MTMLGSRLRSARLRVTVGVLVVGVLAAGVAVALGEPDGAGRSLPRNVAAEPLAVAPLEPAVELELDEQSADPVRVRVPGIAVDAGVGPLDVGADGVLPVPTDDAVTGWWREGPEPGERGPAVVVGHVDSQTGPAVFFRLHEMRGGQQINVDRSDGTTATFTVTHVERHAKDAFPTDAVYGDTDDAQLRLVTCGGEFDRSVHSYRDNIIVYAVRTG